MSGTDDVTRTELDEQFKFYNRAANKWGFAYLGIAYTNAIAAG